MTKIPFYAEVIVNIEFKEAIPDHRIKTERIIIHGEDIGEMNTDENYGSRYHAVINCPGGNIEIIQGHGDTKIEAIQRAIIEGRAAAELRLEAIAILEKKLGFR